jgi:N-acyl-L-homoserine lactone synthetase
MSGAARHSTVLARESSKSSFSDRLGALVSRIEYRRADSAAEREAIFRLRYQAYLREGAIAPNRSGRFTDADDDADNAYIFGLYIDGELASSLRLHIGNKDHPDFPSLHVFPDILQPRLDAGRVILDITRFVADERLSRLHRGLPYVSVRPTLLAAEHFGVDDMLAAVRVEHQAFYQRAFTHQVVCAARPYPQLAKPISLMSLDFPKAASELYRRYPFFLSTAREQQMVFKRGAIPVSRDDKPMRDRLSPFAECDVGQLVG